MKIELWPTEKPIAYARNARKLSDAAVDKVAASIKEFGFRQPIVVDAEGVIIAGHTRLLAAKKLGIKQTPVHVASELTPSQVKTYRLMDNRSHQESEWDLALLGPELLDLKALDLDLSLTGFDADELDMFMAEKTDGLTDEDDAPAAPEFPVTVPGDLWILGKHRLMCGDSTVPTDVDRLMEGKSADMIFTDPPYGISFQSGMSKVGTSFRFDKIKNDDVVLDIAGTVESSLRNDGAAFIWTGHQVYQKWREQFDPIYKQTIIWYKPGGGIGDLKGNYATDYEMCLFCVKGRVHFREKRGMSVWKISKDLGPDYKHPTQKPVELSERAINDFTDAGYAVLDMFGGSGSTLIGCEKTGRTAFLMELDPKYCDVICQRWQDFTGKEAVLEGSGRTFKEIAPTRVKAAA